MSPFGQAAQKIWRRGRLFSVSVTVGQSGSGLPESGMLRESNAPKSHDSVPEGASPLALFPAALPRSTSSKLPLPFGAQKLIVACV